MLKFNNSFHAGPLLRTSVSILRLPFELSVSCQYSIILNIIIHIVILRNPCLSTCDTTHQHTDDDQDRQDNVQDDLRSDACRKARCMTR